MRLWMRYIHWTNHILEVRISSSLSQSQGNLLVLLEHGRQWSRPANLHNAISHMQYVAQSVPDMVLYVWVSSKLNQLVHSLCTPIVGCSHQCSQILLQLGAISLRERGQG